MAEVAVIHPRLKVAGGELVCFAILEQLQKNHDVHLYSFKPPDVEKLNDAFGTSVEDICIHTPEYLSETFDRMNHALNVISGGFFGPQHPLVFALLGRRFERRWNDHDLRISTYGEYPLKKPAIHYIHQPFMHRSVDGSEFSMDGLGALYNRLCTRLAGVSRSDMNQSTVLTNSNWTAGELGTLYGIEPEVVYPPIETSAFSGTDWDYREDGIVWIGRLSPDKRPLQAIQIFEELYERGNEDTHLHMIGPKPDDGFAKRVENRAEGHEAIFIEGEATRGQLIEYIESHKYALHTKQKEHFGIVVAEFVAGGSIPFLPASGGQVEIVNDHPALCYTSARDAVEKMAKFLDGEEEYDDVTDDLGDVTEQFGYDRFQREIEEYVEEKL